MAGPSGASPLAAGLRTVVLVRHGEAEPASAGASADDRVPGPSLTSRGRLQAARAADAVFRVGKDLWPELSRAGALVAATPASTLETAAAVGRRIGQHVRPDERFAEPGESAWAGLRDVVAATDPSVTAVVVSGTGAIRALTGRALDTPPPVRERLRVPPGSLTVLRFDLAGDGAPVLAEVVAVGFPSDV
jgi:broad specificity phosphatase PhoE